jgi:hypothetical protein
MDRGSPAIRPMAHSRFVPEKCSASWMCGSATLTMVPSAGVVPQHVRDGFCRLAERVGLGDDHLDLARFEEPGGARPGSPASNPRPGPAGR